MPERSYIRDLLFGAGGALLAVIVLWFVGAFERKIEEYERTRIAEKLANDSAFTNRLIEKIKGDEDFQGRPGEPGKSPATQDARTYKHFKRGFGAPPAPRAAVG